MFDKLPKEYHFVVFIIYYNSCASSVNMQQYVHDLKIIQFFFRILTYINVY